MDNMFSKILNLTPTNFGLITVLLVVSSCATIPTDAQPEPEEQNHPFAHITSDNPIEPDDIPEIVRNIPVVIPAESEPEPELYSVVVQGVPVGEVIQSMARDAELNIDIHPDITGVININAIDQTLAQILHRIARQSDIRWHFDPSNTLIVEPDTPFFRIYPIDYVNIARAATGGISVTSTIGDSTGSTSSTSLSQESRNSFWETLLANLRGILGESSESENSTSRIVGNPETGIVAIDATSRQHEQIQHYIDTVLSRALSQVLIEATVVEVKLNDDFQSGVDWSIISEDSGVSLEQSVTDLSLTNFPTNVLSATRSIASDDIINLTVSMLSQFGDLHVLSSPKVMTLNNQAALLKVVDNRVYFTIEVQIGQLPTSTTPGTANTFTTTPETVPVGFVMSVTPQISDNGQVTLNVRPTITRIVGFVDDPNPALADAGVISRVPEIQVREIESILKVNSGQVAVLGGLMQDSIETGSAGIPGILNLPIIGNLFKHQSDLASKTELIIFIRPVVIKQADINADLQEFRGYLPSSGQAFSRLDTLR